MIFSGQNWDKIGTKWDKLGQTGTNLCHFLVNTVNYVKSLIHSFIMKYIILLHKKIDTA